MTTCSRTVSVAVVGRQGVVSGTSSQEEHGGHAALGVSADRRDTGVGHPDTDTGDADPLGRCRDRVLLLVHGLLVWLQGPLPIERDGQNRGIR